jgi:hypothetical protein
MDVFLDSPQNFGNLCLLSRTLEVLGVERCYVHDPHRLVRRRYGKSRTRQMKALSAGAFFRVAFERVEQPEAFLAALPGRKVATVPDQHATSLARFAFRPDEGERPRRVSPPSQTPSTSTRIGFPLSEGNTTSRLTLLLVSLGTLPPMYYITLRMGLLLLDFRLRGNDKCEVLPCVPTARTRFRLIGLVMTASLGTMG